MTKERMSAFYDLNMTAKVPTDKRFVQRVQACFLNLPKGKFFITRELVKLCFSHEKLKPNQIQQICSHIGRFACTEEFKDLGLVPLRRKRVEHNGRLEQLTTIWRGEAEATDFWLKLKRSRRGRYISEERQLAMDLSQQFKHPLTLQQVDEWHAEIHGDRAVDPDSTSLHPALYPNQPDKEDLQ